MKVKTFSLHNETEANEFMDSVVLIPDGAVQVTSDSTIVIFYEETKENYKNSFVKSMLENLKRNLFHETVRQAAMTAVYEERKDKGTNLEAFDEASSKQKEIEDNIRMFEAKIAALESWTAKNTSKE